MPDALLPQTVGAVREPPNQKFFKKICFRRLPKPESDIKKNPRSGENGDSRQQAVKIKKIHGWHG